MAAERTQPRASADVGSCAGFSDAGVQVYPRVCAPGVREAPRHEVAGGDRRWCGVRYGD